MKVIIDGVKYYPEGKPQPKPRLADAKVGDLCQRSNGRYTQFHSKHKLKNGSIAYYFTDASGSTDIDGNHCIHECGNNIVSCEPLATEGTAEWALQMMKLGKDVCRKGQETAYYHICNDGKEIACSLKNERRLTCGHLLVSKWGKTGNDWQLYEPKQELVKCEYCRGRGSYISSSATNPGYVRCPTCNGTGKVEKPAPAFKVGDWVEMDYKGTLYHRQVISVHDNGIRVKFVGATPIISFDGKNNMVSMRLVRKLSPSEVKVKVTLEGTVRSSINDCCFDLSTPNGGWATIGYNEIDPATADLVRDLIAKQKGE